MSTAHSSPCWVSVLGQVAGNDDSREELDGGSEEHRHKFVVVVASIEPWEMINPLSSLPHYQQIDYFEWIDDPVAQT